MKLSAITIELPSGEKLLGAVDMETGDTYTLSPYEVDTKGMVKIVKQEGVGTLQKNTCKDYAECTQLKCDCSNVRNKAIDDFMNKLCDHCMQQTNECYNLECPFCTDGCDIVNISEQLKTGVKNE